MLHTVLEHTNPYLATVEAQLQPMLRPPDDIAASGMFFLGDGSRHVTGETLLTDAGMHLGYAPLKAR